MTSFFSSNQATTRFPENPKNFKGVLKEIADQERIQNPDYIITTSGPDNDRHFMATCTFKGIRTRGAGTSKKEAEQKAAQAMYEHLRNCLRQRSFRVDGPDFFSSYTELPSPSPIRLDLSGSSDDRSRVVSDSSQTRSELAAISDRVNRIERTNEQLRMDLEKKNAELAEIQARFKKLNLKYEAQCDVLNAIGGNLASLQTRDRMEGQCQSNGGNEGLYAQYMVLMPSSNYDYSTMSMVDHTVDAGIRFFGPTAQSGTGYEMEELCFPESVWERSERLAKLHREARPKIRRYRESIIEKMVEECDSLSQTVTFSTILHKPASPKNQKPPKHPKIILVQPGSPLPKCRSYDTMVYGGTNTQAAIRETLASYKSASPELKARMVRSMIATERSRERQTQRDTKMEGQMWSSVKNRFTSFVKNVEESASNVSDLTTKAKEVVENLKGAMGKVVEKSAFFGGGFLTGFVTVLPSAFLITYLVYHFAAAGYSPWAIALMNAALVGLLVGIHAAAHSERIKALFAQLKAAVLQEVEQARFAAAKHRVPANSADYVHAMEGQSGGISKVLGKLIATILSIVIVGQAPEGKQLKEIANSFAHYDRLREGASDAAAVALEAIESCYNAIAKSFKWDQVQWCKSGFEEIDVWMNDCVSFANAAYLGPDRPGGIAVNASTGLTLHELRQRGIVLEAKAAQNRLMNGAHSLIRSCQARLASLAGKWEQSNIKMTGPRTPPLSIMVRGNSGVGKSSMCFPLLLCVLNHFFTITKNEAGLRALKEDQYSLFYSRAIEQKYWDGYTNQWVCVWDDFWQNKMKSGGADTEHMDWLRAYNIWLAPLHMANTESKGNTFWTSKIAFATTNVMYDAQDAVILEGVRCADAIKRRIDVDLTLTVNPEYVSEQMKKTVTDRYQWKIDKNLLRLGNKYDTAIPVFHDNKHDVDLNFEQLVDYLVHALVERQEQSEEFKESLHQVHMRDHERFARVHREVLKDLKIQVDPAVFDPTYAQALKAVKEDPLLKDTPMPLIPPVPKGFDKDKVMRWISRAPALVEGEEDHVLPSVASEVKGKGPHQEAQTVPPRHVDADVRIAFEGPEARKEPDLVLRPKRFEGQMFTPERAAFCDYDPERGVVADDVPLKVNFFKAPVFDRPFSPLRAATDLDLRGPGFSVTAGADTWITHYFHARDTGELKDDKDGGIKPDFTNDWFNAVRLNVEAHMFLQGVSRDYLPVIEAKVWPKMEQYSTMPAAAKGAYLLALSHIDYREIAEMGFWSKCKATLSSLWMRIKGTIKEFRRDHPTVFACLTWGGAIITALLAVVGMLALFMSKNTDLEGQSVHRADPKAQGKKVVRPEIRQRFQGQSFDDVFDSTANNTAVVIQTKNLWTMNTGFHSSGVLFVCDNIFLAPRHFQFTAQMGVDEGALTRDSVIRLEHRLSEKAVQIRLTDLLDAVPIVDSPDNDVVIGIIKSTRQLQSRVDLVDNFLTRSTASKITRDAVKATLAVLPQTKMRAELIHLEARILEKAVDVYVEGYETVVRDGFRYAYPTRKGDCMSALLLRDTSTRKQKILGVHIAGDGKMGMTQAVYQEDLIKAIAKVREGYNKVLVHEDSDPPYHCQMFETPCESAFPPVTLIKAPVVGATKTKIIESPLAPHLQEAWPHTKAPAVLKPFLGGDAIIDPFEVSLSKYNKINPVFDLDDIKDCATDYFSTLRSACPDLPKETMKRVLTKEEAVVGIPGSKWWGSMGRSTSVGFIPWFSKMKEIGPDQPGKTIFFGSGMEYNLDNPNARELFARVDVMLDKMRKGERELFIFKDFLKDELRPLQKVAEGKTRFVSPAPIDLTIMFRMYFGAFCVMMQKGAGANGSAIGVNPYSLDWQMVWNKLHEVGRNLYAGDFVEFDSRLLTDVLMSACDEINEFYDDGPENAAIRQMLFLEIVNSRHVMLKMVFEWIGSMPSGNPLTAFLNTIFTNIVLRMVWRVNGGRVAEFKKHVRVIALGDDHVYAVSDAARDLMRPDRVASALAKLGLGYTAADKTPCTGAFMKPEDVTFLKRKWRFEPAIGRMVAPLDLETIHESIQWTKKGEEGIISNKRNFETMLCELALHGKQVFEEQAPIMLKAYDTAYNAHFHLRRWLPALHQVIAIDSPYQAESMVM